MKHLLLAIVLATGFSACGDDDDSSAIDDGTTTDTCDYYCAGPACNLKCENDMLYRCPQSGNWEMEENCKESEKKCVFELIDGGPDAERFCSTKET